jgi:hypothetical protein
VVSLLDKYKEKSCKLALDNSTFRTYITFMEWQVLLDPDFKLWLFEQEQSVQTAILAHAGFLKTFGPSLGRPHVDTLKGSKLANLKELRVQHQGDPWRILFVFDPQRRAILLVGGNKRGDDRWYKKAIPLAEQRYQRHLAQMEDKHGRNT